jgi:hypothetical protein
MGCAFDVSDDAIGLVSSIVVGGSVFEQLAVEQRISIKNRNRMALVLSLTSEALVYIRYRTAKSPQFFFAREAAPCGATISGTPLDNFSLFDYDYGHK